MTTKELQARVMENKLAHHWNTTDLNFELLKLYGEVDELFQAHLHHDQDNFKEECADVAIYLLGIAEIGDVDLGEAVSEKMALNVLRKYDSDGQTRLSGK